MTSCPCRCRWCIMLMGGIIADATIPTVDDARKDKCIPECTHKNCANCKA